MVTLHLLRHAKSSWDGDEKDHDRPLSPRGERAAAAMAVYLRQTGIAPDLILCSDARRTRDTLVLVRDGLPADAAVELTRDLYEVGAAQILDRLNRLDARHGVVMIIGHNPGLEDLASRLAGDRVGAKFPTGGLATLESDGNWKDLGRRAARVTRFVVPKDLV